MGRSKKAPPPPTPVAPPPPVQEVEAEFVAPTMRQIAARRARRGSYITQGERKLGGKARASAKTVAAAREGETEKLNPMAGYSTPERQRIGRKRTAYGYRPAYESDIDYDISKGESKAQFIYKGLGKGREELKSKDEFVNPSGYPKMKGNLASQKIYKEKQNYIDYLNKYNARNQRRLKYTRYNTRTTRLKNLGLI